MSAEPACLREHDRRDRDSHAESPGGSERGVRRGLSPAAVAPRGNRCRPVGPSRRADRRWPRVLRRWRQERRHRRFCHVDGRATPRRRRARAIRRATAARPARACRCSRARRRCRRRVRPRARMRFDRRLRPGAVRPVLGASRARAGSRRRLSAAASHRTAPCKGTDPDRPVDRRTHGGAHGAGQRSGPACRARRSRRESLRGAGCSAACGGRHGEAAAEHVVRA